MRMICAPDSFKESLSAAEAAEAMARGVRRAVPEAEVDCCPVADGGEGTVSAMVSATGGSLHTARVTGPLGEPVEACWGLLGDAPGRPKTAVIEMAAASGLPLVPAGLRDPMRTTTFGTGQLVLAALDRGVRRIILGLGGSATVDGGCGAAQALGVRFKGIGPRAGPITGSDLGRITGVSIARRDRRLAAVELVAACDVTHPLTGPGGAAAVFGPQKGAGPREVEELDRGLVGLTRLWRDELGIDVRGMPGGGAAGGLGAGVVAMLGGHLAPGIDLVLDAVGFERRVQGCAACLTGEGRLDGSSLGGKAVMGVIRAAGRAGAVVTALVGSVGPGAEAALEQGLGGYEVIGPGLSAEESIRRAGELLERAAADWAAKRLAGKGS